MTVINEVMVEVLNVVERAAHLEARNGIGGTLTSATPSPTAAAPAQTSSQSSGSSNGPTSSPLLFFVALGFGVVFTNLW